VRHGPAHTLPDIHFHMRFLDEILDGQAEGLLHRL